jgi:hypothetical protein
MYQPGGLAPVDPVLPASEPEPLELLPPADPPAPLPEELELLPPAEPPELLLPPLEPPELLLELLELLLPPLEPPELLLELLDLLPPLEPPELLLELLELLPPLDWLELLPVLPPELPPPPLAGEHPTASPTARAGTRSNRRVFFSNALREVIRGPPSIRVQTGLATESGTQDRTKTKELVHHSVWTCLRTCRGPASLWRDQSHRRAAHVNKSDQRGSGPPGSRNWSRTLSSSRSSMVWPP